MSSLAALMAQNGRIPAEIAQSYQQGQQTGQLQQARQMQLQQGRTDMQNQSRLAQLRQQYASGGGLGAVRDMAAIDPKAAADSMSVSGEVERKGWEEIAYMANYADTPEKWAEVTGHLQKNGVQLPAQYQQFSPQLRQQVLSEAMQRSGLAEKLKKPEGFTLSEGQARYDAAGNQIAAAPKAQDGFTLGTNQVRYGADGKPLAYGPKEQPKPGDGLKAASDLRSEFIRSSKDFVDTRDAYARLQASDDSAQGDIALLVNFMKMLDPGSVVREGEFATAEQTAGVPDRVRNTYNKLLTGERLNAEQRKGFMNQAGSLYSRQLKSHEALEQQYRQLAGRYQANPDDVVIDYRAGVQAPATDADPLGLR